MLGWAGIRQGSVGDSLAGTWALVLPGLGAPEVLGTVRPEGTGRH
jgi:hypothetical protein